MTDVKVARRSPVVAGVSILLALVFVAYGVFVLVELLDRQERTYASSFPAASIRAVEVDTADLAIHVTGDTSGTASVRASVRFSLAAPHYTARVQDGTLHVHLDCGLSVGIGCNGSLHLAVPPAAAITTHTSDGSVDLAGVTGALDLRTSDGSIHGTGIGSSAVKVRTSDGSVGLTLDTAPSTVDVRTSDGSVRVTLPPGSGPYATEVQTSDGSRHVDIATDPASSRRITVHTTDGSVHLGYGSG